MKYLHEENNMQTIFPIRMGILHKDKEKNPFPIHLYNNNWY